MEAEQNRAGSARGHLEKEHPRPSSACANALRLKGGGNREGEGQGLGKEARGCPGQMALALVDWGSSSVVHRVEVLSSWLQLGLCQDPF